MTDFWMKLRRGFLHSDNKIFKMVIRLIFPLGTYALMGVQLYFYMLEKFTLLCGDETRAFTETIVSTIIFGVVMILALWFINWNKDMMLSVMQGMSFLLIILVGLFTDKINSIFLNFGRIYMMCYMGEVNTKGLEAVLDLFLWGTMVFSAVIANFFLLCGGLNALYVVVKGNEKGN